MRKNGLVLLFILAFLCLQMIRIPATEVAAASFSSLEAVIESPSNKTYNSRFLTLNVTVYWNFASINHMLYKIDGQENGEFSGKRPETEQFNPFHGTVYGQVALPELSEGSHKLTVQIIGMVNYPFDIRNGATVYFTIDTKPPRISSLSVQNETYNQLRLPLNFSVNEPASWMGFTLDNAENVTLTGNSTLSTEVGCHSLVFYANDTAGNMGKSDMTQFIVYAPTWPQMSNFIVFAVIVLTSISAVIVLLLILRTRKPRSR